MAPETKYFTSEPLNANAASPSENPSLTLAYRTFGSPDRPSVLIPSCYCGVLDSTLPFLYTRQDGSDGSAAPAPAPALADYHVIVVGLLGGSESSSPSNAHAAVGRGVDFPRTSYEDNIRLQWALCQALGVRRLAAYVGFSMGGQQAYHMAALYPGFAERVVCIAGSARTSWHNWSFLEGPKAALVHSADFHGGRYAAPARRGTRAFARVYSTWARCPAWYRARGWEALGHATLEDYIREVNEGGMGTWDANDLLCLLQTWQRGDISQLGPAEAAAADDDDRGDLPKALARIEAKVLLMPCRTDMYFPPEDNEEELKHLKDGRLRVIESIGGHLAGGGMGTKEDNEFIGAEIKKFLEE
ncbi:Alpha/Beta hydrolase protein [Xylariomycetidae sp. FL2044]|nr:Alpha/Beta hydrolase protein [Xylariomycetidae sp. FL2044]